MIFKAVLSRTTTDQMKSKIMSPKLIQVVLDVYATPSQYAEILTKYYDTSFNIELTDDNHELEFEKDINV